MTKNLIAADGLTGIFNYLKSVKGWMQLRLVNNQIHIRNENISFKTLEDNSVVAIVGEKQVQRWKGTKEHVAARVHDFLEAFFFYN